MISRRLVFVMLLLVACTLAQDTGTGTAEGTNGSTGEAASEAPTGEEVASEAPTGEEAASEAPTGEEAASEAPTGPEGASEATTGGEEGAPSEATTGGEESASEAPAEGDGASTDEPAPQDSEVEIAAPAASDEPWASEGNGPPLLGKNPDALYKALAPKESYCKMHPSHTGCLYERPDQHQACGKGEYRGFSDEDKETFLRVHNELRSLHAKTSVNGLPTAANMIKLEWSEELSSMAQLWADQCIFGHDKIRMVLREGRLIGVGQNIYEEESDSEITLNPEEVVRDWYEELDFRGKGVPKMTAESLANFSADLGAASQLRSHFTQVVWAKTTKVGCGVARFKGGDLGWKMLAYCNYGPIGNWPGSPIYEAGEACSKCPEKFTGCDSEMGLCTRG